MTKEKPQEHANIGEAWLAIMSDVGYVQKLGKNTAQNYKYAGEAQLIEALRPALLKHSVICMPGAVDVIDSQPVIVGEKKTFRIIAKYTWIYTHVPSNTHMQVEVIGEGVDTGDKSAYKAATGALKYALRQPFLIETGDEPEAHEIAPEKIFKNSATRNEWTKNLIAAIDKAESTAELTIIWNDNRKKLADMEVGEEFDQHAAETVSTRIKVVGAALRKMEAEVKEFEQGMDAK